MTALEVLWITSAGDLLQTWITERSRRAVRDILQVTEKEAYILVEGVEVNVPVQQVRPGDTVVLHTGEKIAVDGVIVKGEALIDESPINGRSESVLRQKGDQVFAGSFVRQGVIFVVSPASFGLLHDPLAGRPRRHRISERPWREGLHLFLESKDGERIFVRPARRDV
jgi:cation-transporting P-type ATPase C